MKPKDLVFLGIRQGRVLTGPLTIHIDLVNACNTDCLTCWDHSPLLATPRDTAWKRKRMPLETVERILDEVVSLGALRAVIISGMGEPFIHPQIYDVIAAVKKRGLNLTIITNLILADPHRVVDLGVDQLLIGIHGASEASYLAFHPSFSSREWKRLHEQLTVFGKAGRRFKHVHVICQTNARELVEMVDLAAQYNAASITFKLASLERGTGAIRITDGDRHVLRHQLVNTARNHARSLGVQTNLDVFERQLGAGGEDTAPIAKTGCFMGYAYARITVDGTVLYCCAPAIETGKLDGGRGFATLWTGPVWNALRGQLRRGEYFADCSRCGKYNQNVAFREEFEQRYGVEAALEVTGRG